MTLFLLVLAGVVIVSSISLSSQLNIHRWDGNRWQFAALCASHACLCAGALGVALGYPIGAPTLLLGVVGQVAFERRRHDRRNRL